MHNYSILGRLIFFMAALFIGSGVFGCATESTTPVAPATHPAHPPVQAERLAPPPETRYPAGQSYGRIAFYPPPARLDFCGEHVPLENQDVMERFDKEFTLMVYNYAQIYRMLKSKERYFPMLEERLRRLNLPDDLKYVAIAEIERPLNAPKRDTGYDFQRAPDSAFQYLGSLYRSYRNWPLALTAFNSGEKRISDECRAQGESNCYLLTLPQETERYVFRVMAVKAILTDPTRYGYELPRGGTYR